MATNTLQLPFELMTFRAVQGKKDPTKTYTIVEGIVTLPDGQRAFCEGFLSGAFQYTPGNYAMTVTLSVNRDRRLEARIDSVRPIQAARAAA